MIAGIEGQGLHLLGDSWVEVVMRSHVLLGNMGPRVTESARASADLWARGKVLRRCMICGGDTRSLCFVHERLGVSGTFPFRLDTIPTHLEESQPRHD
jgi:hypothetical protein